MLADKNNISTLSSIAHMIDKGLASYGIQGAPLFAKADIDLDVIRGPEERVPSVAMQKVWHMAVAATDDPCFGITVAQNMQPAALHGLGFSWIASDTLQDALQRLSRYFRALVSAGEIILSEEEETTILWLKIPAHNGRIVFASLDAALAIFVQMCRLTADADFSPSSIELQREKPDNSEKLEAFFSCPVTYGAEENLIHFDNAILQQPLPTANPALARVNDEIVVDYLARFDRDNITNQVRSFIIELLPSGTPSQESVAKQLHMSLRNLQRKLQAEQTSFKQLLEEIRHELAQQYLKEKQRSIGEITYLLGFSEPSNFARAFKRWAGMSPQEFRALNEA